MTHIWAAQMGVEAVRSPSGGSHGTGPREEAWLLASALRPREREQAFGTRDVTEAAHRVLRQRRALRLSAEDVQGDAAEARSAGVGTGAVAWVAHVGGVLFLALVYFCIAGPIIGILGGAVLSEMTGRDLFAALFDRFPWLTLHLPLTMTVYWAVFAGLNDAAETVRRVALRREYLAWAATREGQLARGTVMLPAPALLGAGFAALPGRVMPAAIILVGLGILLAQIFMGHLDAGMLPFYLGLGMLGAVFYVVGRLQRRRLRRIEILHAAIAGPAGRGLDKRGDDDGPDDE